MLVVTAGGGGHLLVDILTHLMGQVTASLNRNIKNNLGLNQHLLSTSILTLKFPPPDLALYGTCGRPRPRTRCLGPP